MMTQNGQVNIQMETSLLQILERNFAFNICLIIRKGHQFLLTLCAKCESRI